MAGELARDGYAGVASQFSACGWARAELALNQDKSRLQLRRSGSPVNQARSFKFTACAVSDVPSTALSPRSAAIVPPGRRSASPVLRGLRVGEIISTIRERSPVGGSTVGGAAESMVWPHRRGDESLIATGADRFGFGNLGRSLRSARSASPPRGRSDPDEEARMVAMFAAVSAEQEAEVDVLNLGPAVGGRDGRTRPLSPRVRESDWLDGLSSRMAERGGSRLFPTHLAKAKSGKPPTTGSPTKPGGAFLVSGGGTAPKAPTLQRSRPSGVTKGAETAKKRKDPKKKAEAKNGDEKPEAKGAPSSAKAKGDTAASAPKVVENQLPPKQRTLEVASGHNGEEKDGGPESKDSSSKQGGLSKLQLLRKRLEDTMRAAEGISGRATSEAVPVPPAEG